MKPFVDREQEMEFLEQEFAQKRSSFVVLYGRRRLGKTELIKEFIKGKDAVYYLATKESERANRTAFQQLVADYTDSSLLRSADVSEWQPLFEAVVQKNPDTRTIIAIDEFQYIAASNPAFVSVMQKVWDTFLKEENVMLILCGSLLNMMYNQTLSYDSPLYGRRTGQIKLAQIPFSHYNKFYENLTEKQLLEHYTLTGGVPKYIETFADYENIFEAIQKSVLSPQSYLYEEPNFILENEVQEVGSYFSIIKAIAGGKEKPSEIAAAFGVSQTSLPKYFKVLIDLDILEREVPVTEYNPEKSKMGLYKIRDNFFKFWFLFVYPYRSYLEMGNTEFVMKKIEKGFVSNMAGFVYEDICRKEKMTELVVQEKLPFVPERIGRWWDRSGEEIDIVALQEESKQILFGECKYTEEPLDIDVYYKLLKKTEKVKWHVGDRQEHFIFFSFNGYTDDMKSLAEEKGILLY